jgi:hypothetical protein
VASAKGGELRADVILKIVIGDSVTILDTLLRCSG